MLRIDIILKSFYRRLFSSIPLMDIRRRNLFHGKLSSQAEDVRLPWLKSTSLFYDNCTQCGDCVQTCPENIIINGDGGYPRVEFKFGGCTFCELCAKVCPQNLFLIANKKTAWNFRAVVGSSCLSYQQVSCRSCQDSCEYGAINFTPQLGKVPEPVINSDLCLGCGACVSPCPNCAIEINMLTKNTPITEGNMNVS
ncbi:Ferredoxin-type protein NapF (periplasmic nitrate reductase) [hydrothermal vent metagenome]|uniref:Ferredoxin-type protein NapF (Periplasmic nitrate reductase) n=1 Tax=hydrothermal vent metagenome TaxID=652676 RepID=A0A3B0Z1E8_9ZZZZ